MCVCVCLSVCLYLNEFGIVSSMMYMSFEKRLRILPRGVVSKKLMGAWRMLASMLLWILVEAKMLPKARMTELARMKRAWEMPQAL